MVRITCDCDNVELTSEHFFCPRCGRRTGRLAGAAPRQIVLEPQQVEFDYVLRNMGPGPLPFSARIDSSKHIRLMAETNKGKIPGAKDQNGKESPLRFCLAPDAPETLNIDLHLTLQDVDRRNRWWDLELARDQHIPLEIIRQRPATLVVPVKSLLFPERNPIQRLFLLNTGQLPLSVDLVAPEGYTISDSESQTGHSRAQFEIPGDSKLTLFIIRGSSASLTSVPLEIHGASETSQVILRRIQPRRETERWFNYVVGIDFGTVNTSIRLRRTHREGQDTLEPIGPARFPSLLYIEPHRLQMAAIGEQALEKWRGNRPQNAFLVEGIKTLMRLQMEPYLQYGTQWTVAHLLKVYMTQLKKMIEEHLSALSIRDEGNIRYIFTLPVLDNGEQYHLQEERMLNAAKETGFPEKTTEFLSEPKAAAFYLARHPQKIKGLRPGSRICVVDSGGGTTDVCIGKMETANGTKWDFQAEKTFALTLSSSPGTDFFTQQLNAGSEASPQKEREVGGNVVDNEIGYRATSEREGRTCQLPASPWMTLLPTYASNVSMAIGEYRRGIRDLKQRLVEDPSQALDLTLMVKRQNPNASDLTTPLYQIVFGDYTSKDAKTVFRGSDPKFSYGGDVVPVVQELWLPPGMGKRLQDEIVQIGSCDFVIPIGGTTLIPEFEKQIEQYACQDSRGVVDLEGEDRMMAVSEGATWSYNPRIQDVLPYDLELSVQTDSYQDGEQILSRYAVVEEYRPLNLQFDPLKNETVRIKLTATDDHETFEVASLTLKASHEAPVQVVTSLLNKRSLQLHYVYHTAVKQPLWEVSF